MTVTTPGGDISRNDRGPEPGAEQDADGHHAGPVGDGRGHDDHRSAVRRDERVRDEQHAGRHACDEQPARHLAQRDLPVAVPRLQGARHEDRADRQGEGGGQGRVRPADYSGEGSPDPPLDGRDDVSACEDGDDRRDGGNGARRTDDGPVRLSRGRRHQDAVQAGRLIRGSDVHRRRHEGRAQRDSGSGAVREAGCPSSGHTIAVTAGAHAPGRPAASGRRWGTVRPSPGRVSGQWRACRSRPDPSPPRCQGRRS